MHRSRRLWAVAAAILLASTGGAALAGPLGATAPAVPVAATPLGLARLLATTAGTAGPVTGIATFDSVPTAATTAALRGLGLEVQPMSRLSLAIVRGPVAAMQAAVTSGTANDVYPDDPIQLLDTASSDAMGAAIPRSQGLNGEGVTVA